MKSVKSANSLRRFQDLRTKLGHERALVQYSAQLSSEFSHAKVADYPQRQVSVATWCAYSSEGVGFGGMNAFLLCLGVVSFQEKVGVYSFKTYHVASAEGILLRKFLCGLMEFFTLIFCLAGIAASITGVLLSLMGQAGLEVELKWGLLTLFVGLIVVLLSRFLLRASKVLRVPRAIFRDQTSPFKLVSLRSLEKEQELALKNKP